VTRCDDTAVLDGIALAEAQDGQPSAERASATSGMTDPSPPDGLTGFVVLRTAMLPFDDFLEWGRGIGGAGESLQSTRERLRARLQVIASTPLVREALFLASPELEHRLASWFEAPESPRGRKLERAVVRYFARMTGRPTPFGLFAGYSLGAIADGTRLELEPRATYRRRSRLDVGFVDAVCRAYARSPELRSQLRFFPNSSIYTAAGQARYVEARFAAQGRSHHLVAVRGSRFLDAALASAAAGATLAELTEALTGLDVADSKAREYVDELVDAQVLVPALSVAVTGEEPTDALLAELVERWPDESIALHDALGELLEIDRAGVGIEPARYRAVAAQLEKLPAPPRLDQLFQVDLFKPAAGLTVGRQVVDELYRGAETLARVSRPDDPLASFREAFLERYGTRLVPLTEVLDEAVGIGFHGRRSPHREPLLAGLAFPADAERDVRWGAREQLLLTHVARALEAGEREIVLTDADVDALTVPDHFELPRAMSLLGVLAGGSQRQVDAGDFRVRLVGAMTASGVQMLGRFCHADAELRSLVEHHMRAEQQDDPDAVFAEIVHLPEGRHGNVICRPVLRGAEIPYLGRSGAPDGAQIPVGDLLVGIRRTKLALWSRQLHCRVIPRLTSAHDYSRFGPPIYRFLCMLHEEHSRGWTSWSWGPLADMPFLPRVRQGRVVLAAARWRLGGEELRQLAGNGDNSRLAAVQHLRAARGLPRLVTVAAGDDDQLLPIDLDNLLSVETFLDLVKRRDGVLLREFWPQPEELCAHGDEGRFVSEILVPIVRDAPPQATHGPRWPEPRERAIAGGRAIRRSFPPGSEWLFVKLYVGTTSADRVLAQVLERVRRDELCDRWFFIRYADPGYHLRLRFHGNPDVLRGELLPAIDRATTPMIEDGTIQRVVLDTYVREVERYRGPEAIELAERIFHIDSEAVLALIAMLEPGDTGDDERWQIAFCGASMLLDDLGLDADQEHELLELLRVRLGRQNRADDALGRALGGRFRNERSTLEGLRSLATLDGPASGLRPGIEVLKRRSDALAPLVAELAALDCGRQLVVIRQRLAASFVHMHLNRVLRSNQARQELVIYDFLLQLSKSRRARQARA
jgi:thiopeptide-type bacteriocin biosynthesis protein